MKVVIDRFERNFAVVELEEGGFVDMPLELLPDDADEGEVLEISIYDEEEERKKPSYDPWEFNK